MIDVGTELHHPGTHAREQVIDRIMSLNPTAPLGFLERFGDAGLRDYLDHLIVANAPRGRDSSWIRRNDTPAIVWREPAE